MYPTTPSMFVKTDEPLSQLMEGAMRRGHFEGMLTIVLTLFMLIKPHAAYFW